MILGLNYSFGVQSVSLGPRLGRLARQEMGQGADLRVAHIVHHIDHGSDRPAPLVVAISGERRDQIVFALPGE